MTKTTLPRKASETIRLALKDLGLVEKDKKHYKIDMSDWHKSNGKCSVCFAGAVMAQTLGTSPEEDADPDYFSHNTEVKLRSLDYFHTGYIWDGIAMFYDRPRWSTTDRLYKRAVKSGLDEDLNNVPDYNPRNPKPFKDAMRKLATRLARAGF